MLFYKGWLETRVRFILCSIVLFVLCAYSVVQRLDNLRYARRYVSYSNYIYWETYSSITCVVFVLCTLLLGLGGFLRERERGTIAVSLTIPVTRRRLVLTRAAVGLAETVLLACIPALTICMLSPLVRESYPTAQAIKFGILWVFAGMLYYSASFLGSTLLPGEYTAAAASVLGFFVYSFLFGRMPALRPFNVNGIMSAHEAPFLDKGTHLLIGPLPWAPLLIVASVAAALLAVAVFVSERQDY